MGCCLLLTQPAPYMHHVGPTTLRFTLAGLPVVLMLTRQYYHRISPPLSRDSPLASQVCRQLHAQEGLRGFARGIGARCVAG